MTTEERHDDDGGNKTNMYERLSEYSVETVFERKIINVNDEQQGLAAKKTSKKKMNVTTIRNRVQLTCR